MYSLTVSFLLLSSKTQMLNFRPGTNSLLIRTEHGYQLVNLQPNPGQQQGQPFRFQTVANTAPGQQQQLTQVRPQLLSINTQPQVRPSALPHQQLQQQQAQQQVQGGTAMNQQLTVQTAQANSQAAAASAASSSSSSHSQMSPTTAKKKCKNFLSTLIRLASDQPEHVANNVRKLIQGLIVSTPCFNFGGKEGSNVCVDQRMGTSQQRTLRTSCSES